MTPKWPWTVKGQRYPPYVELLPTSPKFHSVLLYESSPNNWGFLFLHRVQWVKLIFSKKIVKSQKLKFSKIPNVLLWGPLGKKFKTSFKTFGCGGVAFWKFHSHRVPCQRKRIKFVKKNNFQNFENPNRSFVRTIRKKIQEEKFENFQLWFVGAVAFWNFRSHRVPC